MLDKRLALCAEMISGKGTVCDVGTDHALLAAELIRSGKCERVIASDIKEGPLDSARKTVEKNGISEKVDIVLSDGLEKICPDGITDIVIAGMGGETIVEIIKNSPFALDGIRMILQPMTKAEILRKWLSENHFDIQTECAVTDGDKLYSVISAEKNNDICRVLTEYEAVSGCFSDTDEAAAVYRKKAADRFHKVSASLKNAGKKYESVHCSSMAAKLENCVKPLKISELYSFLNGKYPFDLQEKWDNSGMLVESSKSECTKILLSLDITSEVVREAVSKGADVIISHHPVIFNPLKKICAGTPVYSLVKNDICAVCMHTNLDIAEGGTNTTIAEKISEKIELSEKTEPLEDCGLGCILEMKQPVEAGKFAELLKSVFSSDYIRMNGDGNRKISKIGICSGSGGSLWQIAKSKGCDALVTGDVKHDIWTDAGNEGFTVFDCGHFHTENIVLWELRKVLEEEFPLADIEIAENSVSPFEVV